MINTSLASVPSRSFDRMNQFMDEMFGNRYDLNPWSTWSAWNPPIDIKETDREYTFIAELPGLRLEDVHVELSNDILSISGKREYTNEDKKDTYIRRERFYGEFKRSFKMDTHVRPDAIAANFKDGMLTVVVPKIEAVKPTKIKVHA